MEKNVLGNVRVVGSFGRAVVVVEVVLRTVLVFLGGPNKRRADAIDWLSGSVPDSYGLPTTCNFLKISNLFFVKC
jgi:hypothetical protein